MSNMKNKSTGTKLWLAVVMMLSLILSMGISAMAEDITISGLQHDKEMATDREKDRNPQESLTPEETQELEELYESIHEIYQKVFNGKETTGLTNKEYKKRVAPYEKELDAMEDRMAELEIKAGLREKDEAEETDLEIAI